MKHKTRKIVGTIGFIFALIGAVAMQYKTQMRPLFAVGITVLLYAIFDLFGSYLQSKENKQGSKKE